MNEIINKTKEFLLENLNKANVSDFGKKYRYEHSLRVANIGLKLAIKENANKKVTVLGCLLHDVGKFETENNKDHGRVSADVSRKFLETLDLTKKEIDDICYAIAVHVDGEAGYEYEHTLEAKIVSDSDNIDRFGAYRIYQNMHWTNDDLSSIEERKSVIKERLEKLKRYYEKGILETDAGNEMFRENLKLQIDYYNRYIEELEMTIVPNV